MLTRRIHHKSTSAQVSDSNCHLAVYLAAPQLVCCARLSIRFWLGTGMDYFACPSRQLALEPEGVCGLRLSGTIDCGRIAGQSSKAKSRVAGCPGSIAISAPAVDELSMQHHSSLMSGPVIFDESDDWLSSTLRDGSMRGRGPSTVRPVKGRAIG